MRSRQHARASEQPESAGHRSDHQEKPEADHRVSPVELRPERRHDAAEQHQEGRGHRALHGSAELVQAAMERVHALGAANGEARNESGDEAVALGQFHKAVAQENARQRQHAGAGVCERVPGREDEEDAPDHPTDHEPQHRADDHAVEDVPGQPGCEVAASKPPAATWSAR